MTMQFVYFVPNINLNEALSLSVIKSFPTTYQQNLSDLLLFFPNESVNLPLYSSITFNLFSCVHVTKVFIFRPTQVLWNMNNLSENEAQDVWIVINVALNLFLIQSRGSYHMFSFLKIVIFNCRGFDWRNDILKQEAILCTQNKKFQLTFKG